MTPRRFPPPWSVEEQSACFVVRDHSGQQLAYVYFEDEPGRLQHLIFWSTIANYFPPAPQQFGPRSRCDHATSSWRYSYNATAKRVRLIAVSNVSCVTMLTIYFN
jgi:hypothetical protein